ncbi:MAG: efflux RND transporter periplasmic adaptor subunit [Pirellulales bacterium]
MVVLLITSVAAAALWRLRDSLAASQVENLLTHRAEVGLFTHDVTERGEVESSSNVEVRCEVQSQNFDGVAIIEIVPEGTIVKKGDFLVKLDDAKLQTDLATQQIALNSSAATVAQAQNDLEAFRFARQEYDLGTYKQEEETLESAVFVAEENFRRAQEYLRYSEKLAARGYVTDIQLEADRFAVEKNRKELDVAKTKLEVLRVYTREKTLKKHDADIKTAEAKLTSELAKHRIELDKLAVIEQQIVNCQISAPEAGQVVYANDRDRWRGDDDSGIRAGTKVRERQVIIRLPDPKKMQVEAKISEARIDLVKAGMPVKIQMDALPGVALQGEVEKVDPYPSQENWFNANIKEYATYIKILDPPAGLRPGMTAKVAIRVETTPDVLLVPVQAVIEREGKHYCMLSRGQHGLEPREVLIGSTNDKFLVIRDGLSANDAVLMNPRVHLSKVELPKSSLAEPEKVAAQAGENQAGTPAERPET